jgi:hypothetical protein
METQIGSHKERHRAALTGSAKAWRWAVGTAGVVMVITAGLHALGFRPVSAQLAASTILPELQGAIQGLWLVFSLHMLIIGGLFLVAGIRPSSVSKTVLAVAGLVPLGDTVVLYSFVGPFVGTVALAVSAIVLYVGVALRPGAVKGK